jgi:hypothetical protein
MQQISLKERLKSELDNIVDKGYSLLEDLENHEDGGDFKPEYQGWYTKALSAVKELSSDRFDEFLKLYKIDNRKEVNSSNFCIRDFLLDLTHGYSKQFFKHTVDKLYEQQVLILEAIKFNLDNILVNIRGLIEAEFLDNEIDASRELLKFNHLRAAGTLAGVVLERHFFNISKSRELRISKNPSISDYNDKFKNEGIYDIPTWRLIQRLSDIRNYCCHLKERDPQKEEVEELITGVEKIIKTVF